jgi:hypothetical protein
MSVFSGSSSPLFYWQHTSFFNREDTTQAIRESIHRAHLIIGGHVDHGVFVGSFFQHVSGNSEPVSAV